MKTTRTFRGGPLLVAVVIAITIGEVIAWHLAAVYGIRNNPIVVAFLCTGLVAAIASVLYEGADVG